MKTGLSLEEAQSLLLSQAAAVPTEQLALTQACGRVTGKDIASAENVPPFDRSPLDGYAMQAADMQGAGAECPIQLSVIEEIRAGFTAQKKVTPGTAIKVMTGAPIPEGADVVIRYEDVKREKDSLFIFHELNKGNNIVPAGEDVSKDEVIVRQGERLTAPRIGLLAAIGKAAIPAFNKVKVALISTGDELVDPSEQLQVGKIHNSNVHSLGARCQQLGAEPLYFGIVPDEKDVTAERMRQALKKADLVITTGGVSVGDFDVVPATLKQIGADVLFWKVKMKPGSPVIAAQKDGKLLIGLSGNPAAALITFDLLVVPVIKKMMGLCQQLPMKITAVLANDFAKESPQRRFLRGKLEISYPTNRIRLTGNQQNGVLKSMIDCDVLIDVPAGSGPLMAGQKVTAVMMENVLV
ncbi:Molybdopterin molybdenumtransferase [bioreactor metagenome]|uniref:molybdopterin molybdotransferase n=1 Tax=bioreactor metagenome TaxID=1076179 RepID=A0A644TFY6_9ZZZZ|nr:molybdopterin molybdotransferase MoeA [Negativicutes bacterium]